MMTVLKKMEPSFPRRRESDCYKLLDSRLRGNDGINGNDNWGCKPSIKKMLSILLILPAIALAANGSVQVKAYDMAQFNKTIQQLYATVPASHSHSISKRINAASAFFLGKPYHLWPTGEGKQGKFDQKPIYRTDMFDCGTYVETVLALAESNNLQQFQKNILKIRYKDAQISYLNRNHFISVDWNPNNARNGYIKDITYKFVDPQGQPVAAIAVADINKPGWYNKKNKSSIKSLDNLSKQQVTNLVKQLQQLGAKTQQEKSVMLYIPLSKLFTDGKPNEFLFSQIPSGSIIEIIRPNWNVWSQIGTRINVSHLGFAVRTKQGLMYREASSLQHKVIDTPLEKYLLSYIFSKTVKGINVEQIV